MAADAPILEREAGEGGVTAEDAAQVISALFLSSGKNRPVQSEGCEGAVVAEACRYCNKS